MEIETQKTAWGSTENLQPEVLEALEYLFYNWRRYKHFKYTSVTVT